MTDILMYLIPLYIIAKPPKSNVLLVLLFFLGLLGARFWWNLELIASALNR